MIEVTRLSAAEEAGYDAFAASHAHASFFHSLKYRRLLEKILPESDSVYLIARLNGAIVGVLPSFIRRSSCGNVLNSLPFYGSHGGALASDGPAMDEVKQALLARIRQIALEERCLTSTIVTPLFEADVSSYEAAGYDFRDSRIGQVTVLPDGRDSVGERLMTTFHSKTRNMVRKAYKAGLDFFESAAPSDLEFLADLHRTNCAALGIVAKHRGFFLLVPELFEWAKEYKIWVAAKGRERAAALLLFYHNQTVEYFTPCSREEFRSDQPMSLLIFEAMKDAAERGFRRWNWGGTGAGLEGIYRFKKRWGATDHRYFYYTSQHQDVEPLLKLGKNGILSEYPYFYTIPFSSIAA